MSDEMNMLWATNGTYQKKVALIAELRKAAE
jgi:hypothetical protein